MSDQGSAALSVRFVAVAAVAVITFVVVVTNTVAVAGLEGAVVVVALRRDIDVDHVE